MMGGDRVVVVDIGGGGCAFYHVLGSLVSGVFSCGCCMIGCVVYRERSVFGSSCKKEEVIHGFGLFEKSGIEVKNGSFVIII